ncbi:MAG: DUF3500 domain-containing protein [Thermoanaerobaculia bacterium]
MAESANRFLAALAPEERARAMFPFDGAERFDWGFTPRSRRGISLKELDDAQRKLAHDFLRTGLSASGYRKAADVIALESVLRELQGAYRDPDLYFFSVFGTPSQRGVWGWRVEGHHLSLNYTAGEGGGLSFTPSFFGANPATVRRGPLAGKRTLAGEEDRARELLRSLDAGQRRRAVLADSAPRDIVTETAARVEPLSPPGLSAGDLEPAQRELLRKLLDEYLSRMPQDLADERLAKLRAAGFERITFAWAGGFEPAQPHYYRLQGPTFLIEYDNTQDDANHIHTVWRDFEGDFGRDLLREHYGAQSHVGGRHVPRPEVGR